MKAEKVPMMDPRTMREEMKKGMDHAKMLPKDHGKVNHGQMIHEMKQTGGA